jgi:uncharacterized protein (TIRG00374 family)
VSGRPRKILILSAKLVLAAVLLGWVLSQVHWSDYVQAKADGKTYAVVERLAAGAEPAKLRVARGVLWWRRERLAAPGEFEPVPGSAQVVRAGFATTLRNINVPLAVLGAMGFGAALLITSGRWWMLLRIQDIRISLWEAVRLTFLGQFFNAVVPGTVGGDLVKAYYVAKHTPKKAAVLVSVFADRVLGLAELTLMASVMMALVLATGRERFEKLRTPAISLAVVVVVVIGALAFLLSGRFRRALRLQKLYRRLPVAHHIAAAGDAARLYRRRLGSLAKAILITLGAHVAFVGFVALIGMSLSVPTPWYSYFMYVPLIYILGAVPLTPGGVGLIETFYVDFFRSPQCGPSTILALAMLARLIPILWGLPGAVVAVTGAKVPKAESMQAELGIEDDSRP